ncbi:MAG TPA: response regulator [Terriglobales bacterium]
MSAERVMVVCEESELRDSITQLIENHGMQSFAAADGIDALRQIYHVRPRLIVSEAELSRLSGFEFLPFVRRRFPTVGVIALAASDANSQENAPVADLLVPKTPWNPERLMSHVHQLLAMCPLREEFKESDCA